MRDLVHEMEIAQERERFQIHRGRPRLQINQEQLIFLAESNFRVKDIATLFSCSSRTIERRLHDLHIRLRDFSDISDAELDEIVGRIVTLHPRSGEKTVSGQLQSQGHKVQRERIRLSLHRVASSPGFFSRGRKREPGTH